MDREIAKEVAESITIYEMDGKYKPVSHAFTNNGTPIYGKLDLIGNSVSESGSYGLNLEFLRAFPDKKTAVNAAKKKWGSTIDIQGVKVKEKNTLIVNQEGIAAIKKSYLSEQDSSIVQEDIHILRKGTLGELDAAYIKPTIEALIKDGKYSHEDYKEFIKNMNPEFVLDKETGWTVGHESATFGWLSKDFKEWDISMNNGWTVAHEAAKNNNLPENFKNWDIVNSFGDSVKTVSTNRDFWTGSDYDLQKRIKKLPDVVMIDLVNSRRRQKDALPQVDKNIVGKSQINKDMMNSNDWLKAKAGDITAANRVVDSLWSQKKTDQLKELIGDGKDKVLVTMPSTSGFNVLPKVMAEKLAKEFDGKLQVIQGDEFFNLTHNAEVKNISRFDRVFFERKYKTEKPFDKNLEGKKAVLVDDIFTTGGSVKAFSKELSNNKLEVSNVVGLMGDKRFNVDEKTEQKFKEGLTDAGIAADTNRLKNLLTRTEAGLLIQRLNREKGLKNEKFRELTKRISGLYKGLFVKDIRGNRKPGRDNSPGIPHKNNAKDVKGLQDRGSRGGQGR